MSEMSEEYKLPVGYAPLVEVYQKRGIAPDDTSGRTRVSREVIGKIRDDDSTLIESGGIDKRALMLYERMAVIELKQRRKLAKR